MQGYAKKCTTNSGRDRDRDEIQIIDMRHHNECYQSKLQLTTCGLTKI